MIVADGFGDAQAPIFLEQTWCEGREASLLDCPRGSALGVTSCTHSMDVAVRCFGETVDEFLTATIALHMLNVVQIKLFTKHCMHNNYVLDT